MRVKYNHVSFAYGSNQALKDLNCELHPGRTVLIAGHNGSGKSTFLKMMNGILKPTGGEVILGETPTRDKSTSELSRLCALSFQNPDDQLFAQTVERELRFGLDNIQAESILLEPVIQSFGLEVHLNSNPYSLTYALRRLVAIAGSAVMNTPIIALDEPTAGLSIREKKLLGLVIALLKERRKTIAIVTHDLNFLLPYADDILVLSHGEIRFFGKRDELFSRNDRRRLMTDGAMGFPVYARLSYAVGIETPRFDAGSLVADLRKK